MRKALVLVVALALLLGMAVAPAMAGIIQVHYASENETNETSAAYIEAPKEFDPWTLSMVPTLTLFNSTLDAEVAICGGPAEEHPSPDRLSIEGRSLRRIGFIAVSFLTSYSDIRGVVLPVYLDEKKGVYALVTPLSLENKGSLAAPKVFCWEKKFEGAVPGMAVWRGCDTPEECTLVPIQARLLRYNGYTIYVGRTTNTLVTII